MTTYRLINNILHREEEKTKEQLIEEIEEEITSVQTGVGELQARKTALQGLQNVSVNFPGQVPSP